MAISVVPSTDVIVPIGAPSVKQPATKSEGTNAGEMVFDTNLVVFNGSVTLRADAGDNVGGTTLGWIQIEFAETNWGIYMGAADNDGSCLERRDSNFQPCRDTSQRGGIFFDGSARGLDQFSIPPGTIVPSNSPSQTFPMAVTFKDAPDIGFMLQNSNHLTHKMNFLKEVLVEMKFCTVLTLRWPNNDFKPLRHIFWSVKYHYFCLRAEGAARWATQPIQPSVTVGQNLPGAPTTSWASQLTDRHAANCLAVSGAVMQQPAKTFQPHWFDFNP
jgi:hypothetical protein